MKITRWTYRFLLMAMGVVVMGACGSSKTAKEATADKPAYVERGRSPEYSYIYYEAVRQENAGNYAAAFDLFEHALSLDSLAPETYFALAPYYYEFGDSKGDSIALSMMQKAVELNPYNDDYHERLAQGYMKIADYNSAIETYEDLYATKRSRTDVLNILLQLYQQKKDYKHMLSTIDRMEEVDGTSEELTLAKMQVYQMQGDKNAAYNSLAQLVEEHPNDVNYKVMLGNWLQQNSRKDEALEMFLAAENDDPNNEFAAESLYDYYHGEGMDSLANIYRERILMNKYASKRTRLQLVQQLIREVEVLQKDSTEVLDVLERMMAVDKEDIELAAFTVTYMQMKNMSDSVQKPMLNRILDVAPDNSNARLQLVGMSWKEKDWQEVETQCRSAIEYNPEEILFCYFLGLSCYQQDKDEDALEAFQKGASKIDANTDKNVASDFYAIMGDIYHKQGKSSDAYAAYDNCLQWKPDNISCLNNYAYYLSEDDPDEETLKKAELMSLKTVTAEPENSTYLDTYAWILFLAERYAEAKVYIDKAVEHLEPDYNNSTIYDHAGDIYIVLGKKVQAIDFWQKAIDEGSENASIIKKKIKRYGK